MPVQTGVASPEFKEALSKYFASHSFDETSVALSDLLQAWISPDIESTHSNIAIADQVFFVHNLSAFIFKVAAIDLAGQLGIDDTSEERIFILEFFDSFGWDYPTELLMEALQSWLCPDQYGNQSLKRIADVVSTFSMLEKLIRTLEALNAKFEMEGGLSC